MIVNQVRNDLPNRHLNENTSTLFKSAHDKDCKISSVFNIDDEGIKNIPQDQVEWESDLSIWQSPSVLTEKSPIDESDGNEDPQPRHFEHQQS